jgi:actin related protein 2/3 complex subunit 1A/1B
MKVVAVCYYEHQNNWWVSKHIKVSARRVASRRVVSRRRSRAPRLGSRPQKHRSTVLSVAWCPNDKFVVTGATDNRARIFSAFIKNIDREEDDGFGSLFPSQNQFGELLMEFDQSRAWVNSVAWAPSGLRIAYSTHASQVVFVQLLAQGSHVQVLNHAGLPFLKCEFASDNTLVCVGFDMNPTVFTATGDAAAPKWALAKLLDSNEKKADDAAKGATSAAAAARAMWSNKDAKAIETPPNSTLAETVLPTRHQNSIVSLCRFKKPTVFSTAAIDGRVLFWDLAASGVAV